jgi:hypothetical protein
MGGEQAVQGAHRAQIRALVEQRGIDRSRGAVDEVFRVQQVEDALSLGGIQGARR